MPKPPRPLVWHHGGYSITLKSGVQPNIGEAAKIKKGKIEVADGRAYIRKGQNGEAGGFIGFVSKPSGIELSFGLQIDQFSELRDAAGKVLWPKPVETEPSA